MTDREQTRRDAVWFIAHHADTDVTDSEVSLAQTCVALLAELEQAERALRLAVSGLEDIAEHRVTGGLAGAEMTARGTLGLVADVVSEVR